MDDDCGDVAVRMFSADLDVSEVNRLSAGADYLGGLTDVLIDRDQRDPLMMLRNKLVADWEKFAMSNDWMTSYDDDEKENKRAYEYQYDTNPKQLADKKTFDVAEARIKNKNSILKEVMTDPGRGTFSYTIDDGDQVNMLRESNRSFISARDKYFVPPQGQSTIVQSRNSAQEEAIIQAEMHQFFGAKAEAMTPVGTT